MPFAISDAISSFEAYTIGTPTKGLRSQIGKDPECLADFIQAWMESGEGIRACLGDRQTFTLAVIAIIDHWGSDPGVTDFISVTEGQPTVRRPVDSIFGPRGFDDHDVTNPHWFATFVFRELHGKSR
ncbi:hypothetical protein OHR68_14070 [Spirillospora sp. NBC_00431]